MESTVHLCFFFSLHVESVICCFYRLHLLHLLFYFLSFIYCNLFLLISKKINIEKVMKLLHETNTREQLLAWIISKFYSKTRSFCSMTNSNPSQKKKSTWSADSAGRRVDDVGARRQMASRWEFRGRLREAEKRKSQTSASSERCRRLCNVRTIARPAARIPHFSTCEIREIPGRSGEEKTGIRDRDSLPPSTSPKTRLARYADESPWAPPGSARDVAARCRCSSSLSCPSLGRSIRRWWVPTEARSFARDAEARRPSSWHDEHASKRVRYVRMFAGVLLRGSAGR